MILALCIAHHARLLVQRFEDLSLPYLARIWRKRAELMGGRVPVLNVHGDKIVMARLRDDGRVRCFATGVHFRPDS